MTIEKGRGLRIGIFGGSLTVGIGIGMRGVMWISTGMCPVEESLRRAMWIVEETGIESEDVMIEEESGIAIEAVIVIVIAVEIEGGSAVGVRVAGRGGTIE